MLPRNRRRPSHGATALTLVVLLALAVGCAGRSVGARRISGTEADRRLAANVLATGAPSAWSMQTLHRNVLLDVYREDPVEALTRLHATLAEPNLGIGRRREHLFALSELSFGHARDVDENRWFLAAAVYAYSFLVLDTEYSREAVALDSRTRLAADLYNRGLTEGLKEDGALRIADGERELPFGSLSLDLDEASLRWGSFLLTDFVPTAELETHGFANRYRHAGVGAPLAAAVEPAPGESGSDAQRIPPISRVSSTLFMQLDLSDGALVSGQLRGTLSLHTADLGGELWFEGRRVPLELDFTAALALGLDSIEPEAVSRRAFLSGGFGDDTLNQSPDHLAMLFPYRRGRVPVVFVHGTNSDPTTWAEMLNELANDRILSDRLQFWFFFYGSGNPIGYSAGLLAQALREIAEELDPDGSDPALHQMVIIGHSQGGLLTKHAVVDSGLRFWDLFFKQTPEKLTVGEETRAILERSLIFESLEPVSRVVFVSTPHGGSFLTRNPIAGWINDMITIPATVRNRIAEVLRQDPNAIAMRSLEDIPTSLDNMRPGDPYLETLRSLPIAADVEVHSIVAVEGSGPLEQLSDGVVEYLSAHIEVGTEVLVRSGHSAQGHPEAIAEVRRILREHLSALEATGR